MKNGLIILPFAALFILGIFAAVGSAYVDYAWISYVGYGLAAVCVGLWVYLDRAGFKLFFSRKSFRYGASSGLLVLLVSASLVLFSYVTQNDTFNKRWDVTKNKNSTLADSTLEVIGKLEAAGESVQAQGFFLNPGEKGTFQSRIGHYVHHGAPIEVEYIDPQKNPEVMMAQGLQTENTVIFTLGSRESRITSFGEEEITNTLLNLLKDGSKKVYFTKGHGEPAVDDDSTGAGFGLLKRELEGQKIEVAGVSLFEQAAVPEDADLLVVAGPQFDLKEGEVGMLKSYVEQGGALLVAVDAVVPVVRINELTQRFGVTVEEDFLILDSRDLRSRLYGQGLTVLSDFDPLSGITKKFSASGPRGGVEMLAVNARSVSVQEDEESASAGEAAAAATVKQEKDYSAQVLVKSVRHVGQLTGIREAKDLQDPENLKDPQPGPHGFLALSTLLQEPPQATPNEGEDGAKEDALASKEPGKLVAIGSSFILRNQGIKTSPVNREFVGSLISYLVRDENFVSIPNKEFERGNLDLSSKSSQFMRSFIVFIFPFLFLAVSIIYWLQRRRKAA